MTPRRIVYTLGLGALAASVRELHTVPQHIDAPLSPLTPLPLSLPAFSPCFLSTLRGCVPSPAAAATAVAKLAMWYVRGLYSCVWRGAMRCGPAVLLLQCVSEFFSLFLSYTPTPPPPPAPFFLFPFSPTLSRPRHPVLIAQLFFETHACLLPLCPRKPRGDCYLPLSLPPSRFPSRTLSLAVSLSLGSVSPSTPTSPSLSPGAS